MLALGLPAAAEPAAYPYQVSSTADSGPSTLRSAIEAANATPGVPDTIPFAIDDCPAGVCTIVLDSPLPALTDPAGVTINGYTQSYASEAHDNIPASLKIVIDGNGHDCLTLTSANNVIKGLDIRNCNCGVTIQSSDASDNVVAGNHIGTEEANVDGVWIAGGAHDNTIGGDTVAERNVISNNDHYGVRIEYATTAFNTVSGNYIGTDASGSAALGNGYHGVDVYGDADDNVIGPGNLIAYNTLNGVLVYGITADRNRITENSIHSNSWSGIDLEAGANGNIAAPVITGLAGGSPFAISGTACDGCTVEVFASATDDGEGEVYLGTATAAGGAFTLNVPTVGRPFLTATATDAAKGTSEFSAVYEGFTRVYLPLVLRNS